MKNLWEIFFKTAKQKFFTAHNHIKAQTFPDSLIVHYIYYLPLLDGKGGGGSKSISWTYKTCNYMSKDAHEPPFTYCSALLFFGIMWTHKNFTFQKLPRSWKALLVFHSTRRKKFSQRWKLHFRRKCFFTFKAFIRWEWNMWAATRGEMNGK